MWRAWISITVVLGLGLAPLRCCCLAAPVRVAMTPVASMECCCLANRDLPQVPPQPAPGPCHCKLRHGAYLFQSNTKESERLTPVGQPPLVIATLVAIDGRLAPTPATRPTDPGRTWLLDGRDWLRAVPALRL